MYLFRLAERLGKTVRELLASLDSEEVSEWIAFDRIDQPQSWMQTAQICAVMDSCWNKKPRKLETFLPIKRRPRRQPISPAELRARLSPFRNPKGSPRA